MHGLERLNQADRAPVAIKCCECKREARSKHAGYGWMCTRHYKALIKFLRIKRGLEKSRKRYTTITKKSETN